VHTGDEAAETLQQILYTLRSVRDKYIVSFDTTSRADSMRLVQLVLEDCAMLRENPDMFPDMQTFNSFFAVVNQYTFQIQKTILLWREHRQRHEEIGKLIMDKKLQSARPRHLPELATQPWQQYLSKESPAWPVSVQKGPGYFSTHVIPNGGVRLIEKWESELKAIYEGIDIVRIYGVFCDLTKSSN
jgi:hypothetical protein